MPFGESSVLVRLRLLGAARFRSEAVGAAAGLGTMEKASLGAATRLRGVGRAMGTAGAGLAAGARFLRRAALPLAVIGAASIKAATDFQQAMEMIHTQAGASQKSVDKLRGQVLALAKVRPQGPTELANALYRLEGAGIRGQNAMKALRAASNLAAVGNANVEDTAKTLAQTWFSGIKGAKNFNNVVAELNATVGAGDLRLNQLVDALGVGILPVAKMAGLHFRDITGALSLFGDETNNVSGWTAQLATALHYLYAPTDKAKKALGQIGIGASQLARDFRKKNGLSTALGDLRKHLDKLPGGVKGVQAGQVLASILPGGRGRVVAVLLSQLDRYRAKLRQVGNTTNNWADAVAKTHQTAAFRIKTAWSSIQATGVQLGSVLLPVVAPAFEGVAKGINAVVTAASHLGKGRLGKTVSGFFSGIGGGPKMPKPTRLPGRAMEPQLAPTTTGAQRAGLGVRGALGAAWGWIMKQAPKVGKVLMKAGKQLVQAFKPAMPFVKNVLLPLLKGIAIGVLGGVVVAFKILVPVIRIFAGVLGFVGKAMAPFKGVITALGMAIGFLLSDSILGLLGALPKVGFVFRIMAVPVRIVNGVFRILGRVVLKVGGFFLKALTSVQRFVGTFRSAPARVLRAALNIVGGIIHTIGRLPGRMVGMARSIVSKLVGGLSGAARSAASKLASIFGKVGKAIVSAIVSAIKHAPGAIVGAVTSIVPKKVRGIVKGALGWTGLATGGRVQRGGWAVVGERGPELAHFPPGSQVYDARQTQRARSGNMMSAPLYLTANLHLSGKQIHSEIFKIDQRQREAM